MFHWYDYAVMPLVFIMMVSMSYGLATRDERKQLFYAQLFFYSLLIAAPFYTIVHHLSK